MGGGRESEAQPGAAPQAGTEQRQDTCSVHSHKVTDSSVVSEQEHASERRNNCQGGLAEGRGTLGVVSSERGSVCVCRHGWARMVMSLVWVAPPSAKVLDE